MEFPRLYGDLQAGFEPLKFLETLSVRVDHAIRHFINRPEHSPVVTGAGVFKPWYGMPTFEVESLEVINEPLCVSERVSGG